MSKIHTIKLLPEALSDIQDSVNWYEEQKEGLGKVFAGYIKQEVDALKNYPLKHPKVFKNIRKKVLLKFPYKIFYKIEDETSLLIVAVLHSKRLEAIYKKRVK